MLSREEEARYGYLAAVNSTTLADGAVLDLGGGTSSSSRVAGGASATAGSWPLGAVRMTERFLPGEETSQEAAQGAARPRRAQSSTGADWLAARRAAGSSASAARSATSPTAAQQRADLPSFGVQGFVLTAEALDELIDELAALPAAERGVVPGIKPERGDLILAGAVVVADVMEAGGFEAIEVTEAGLREGVFFESLLAATPTRRCSTTCARRACATSPRSTTRRARTPSTSRASRCRCSTRSPRRACTTATPRSASCCGRRRCSTTSATAVDYDDHHKHSRYLILNAGLPGFTPARGGADRADGALPPQGRTRRSTSCGRSCATATSALLDRGAALLRLAEQLERGRDQLVRDVHARLDDGAVRLTLEAERRRERRPLGRRAPRDLFERAFGRPLRFVE